VKAINFESTGESGVIEESDQHLIKDSVDRLGLAELPDEWEVYGGSEYRLLLIELVIIHCPNLETLRMPLDHGWELNLLQSPMAKGFFQKLKALYIHHFYTSGDLFAVSTYLVEQMLATAPNLERLKVPTLTGGGTGSQDSMDNLRCIEFTENCTIDSDLLSDILASCPKLEIFALHWDALDNHHDYVDDIRAMDAWVALSQARDTLREIRLDIRDDLPLGTGDWWSIQDFKMLEELKVNGHALCALRDVWATKNPHARVDSFLSQCLPPTIKAFTLWKPNALLIPGMLRLAKVVSVGRYPSLKSVTLVPSETSERTYDSWNDSAAWSEVQMELAELFKRSNTKFEMKYENKYWTANGFT
jgi:hypothetical protein